jgi:UDP-glucose 4-epimerase
MGGLGFIGSHLCRFLLHRGYAVRVFDRLHGSTMLVRDLLGKIEIYEGDAEKPEDVMEALARVDTVVNLIHTTVPGTSMHNPVYDIESNVAASVKWLKQLEHTDVKRIIYISSGGTVYGRTDAEPIRESHPTDPICSYGVSKLMIEKYLALYASLAGKEHIVCRPGNIYGEGQRLNIGQGVIGVFLHRYLQGLPIEIWGDGSVQRDYLYVGDMINAIYALMHYRGSRHVFHISSGVGLSLNDIVGLMRRELALELHIEHKLSRGFDVSSNILDNSLLLRETGWKPKTDIRLGIRRVYEYLGSSVE